jgi:HEAT repeat protein
MALVLFSQDDEVKAKLAEFNKAKAQDLKKALESLASLKHPRILKELLPYLKNQPDDIKRTAAKLVGEYKGEKSAAEELAAVAVAEAARARKNNLGDDIDHDVAVAMLQAFGSVGVKETAPKIHALFDHQNTAVAKAAIQASEDLKNLDSVEPLIRLLQELERSAQIAKAPRSNEDVTKGLVRGRPGSGGVAPGKEDDSMKQAVYRFNALEPSIQEALKTIGGESSAKKGAEWAEWWTKNKAELRAKEKRK